MKIIDCLLRRVQLSDGARASARFNVHYGATQEMPGPLPFRALKRRERRAPFAPYVCHSILRFSTMREFFYGRLIDSNFFAGNFAGLVCV